MKRPLGPYRAKGIGFNWEARRRVGFTQQYIEQLAVSSDSQGRPPRVYWFDPTVEDAIALGKGGEPPVPVRELVADLETLPMFGAARDDVVWVRRPPRARFLVELAEAGFAIPEFVSDERGGRAALADRPLAELCPWGWSPRSAAHMAPLRGQLSGGAESSPRWSADLADVYSKAFGVEQLRALLETERDERLCDMTAVGRECRDPAAVHTAIEEALVAGARRIVVKAALAAAGRHRRFVEPAAEDAPAWDGLDRATESWLQSTLARRGAVVVEPWLDGLANLSYHFSLSPAGDVVPDGLVRFLTDARGGFEGAVLGRRFDDLEPDVVRFVYGDGHDPKWLERLFGRVASRLRRAPARRRLLRSGRRRRAGVPAPRRRRRAPRGVFRLKPIVEVNPRHTIGRVALHLERHLWRGRAGLWRFLPLGRVGVAGSDGAGELARRAARLWPAEVGHTPAPLLRGGVVLTTDPRESAAPADRALGGAHARAVRAAAGGGRDGPGLATLALTSPLRSNLPPAHTIGPALLRVSPCERPHPTARRRARPDARPVPLRRDRAAGRPEVAPT